MGNIDKIGNNIRSLRKANKMTLQELAKATGLSTGYISNIERNMSSPTLSNLQKICEVFDTSLGDLIDRTVQERIVIRRSERVKYIEDEPDMKIDDVDFGIDYVNFLFVELKPLDDKRDEKWTHIYDEVGTVIRGQLTVVIDNEEFDLYEGDTIYVKAHTKHSFYNKSAKDISVSYWTKIDVIDEEK